MRQLSWSTLTARSHNILACGSRQHPILVSHVRTQGYATRRTTQSRLDSDAAERRYRKKFFVHEFERLPEWPQLPADILEKRVKTVLRVQSAVRDAFGHVWTVKPFGSTCYGADSAESDIDLVILDPHRPKGLEPVRVGQTKVSPSDLKKRGRIYNVRALSSVLRQYGFHVERVVPSAAVPIVKFRDKLTNLTCDINVNEQLGYRNTHLIRRYCMIWPLLPSLILAIKGWAAGRRWLSATNSYTLALMTIGVLQARGVLPNLQKEPLQVHPDDDRAAFYVIPKRTGGLFQRCDTRFNMNELDWAPSLSLDSIDDALYLWFRYWGYEHQYEQCAMDIRGGGVVTRQRGYLDVPEQPRPRLTASEEEDAVLDLMHECEEEDAAKAEAALAEGAEEFDEPLELDADDEPLTWIQELLIMRDPFLRNKNCCGRMTPRHVKSFQADCREQADALEEVLKTSPSFETLKALPPVTPTTPS